MDNNIATMLDAEICRTLEEVKTLKAGSEEAKGNMIKLEKLHTERIRELELMLKDKQTTDASLAKIDESNFKHAELDFKIKQAEQELILKQAELNQKDAELKEAKKGRRWRTVLDLFGIVIPIGATAWWMREGLKFEEEGKIYSSRTAQWVGNLARLFKKG